MVVIFILKRMHSETGLDESENTLDLRDGLSEATFAALMQFLPTRSFEDDTPVEGNSKKIEDSTVCVAYTANDVSVIAETFKRLATVNAEKFQHAQEAARSRTLLTLEPTNRKEDILQTLICDGIVRVNQILASDICDRLLNSINSILANEIARDNKMTRESGFGNVLCREHRWDLYLRNEGVCNEALTSLIGPADSVLNILFTDLIKGQNAEFHELSALISDPGAASQPIHPDSVFTEEPVMFTVFIALQDIEDDMGPTIFLPRTHTEYCHHQHKDVTTKDDFLAQCEYRQSTLRKGDAVVMDSRTLHCGAANDSSRRVLLYFTIRNPHTFHSCVPAVPAGSKWDDMDLNLHDFA